MALTTDRPLSVSSVTDTEGDSGTKTFTFVISAASVSTVFGYSDITFRYRTLQGSALVGSDFIATSGTGHIGVNDQSMTVTVSVVGDRIRETDEIFALEIFDIRYDGNLSSTAPIQGIGTIRNDDAANRPPVINGPGSAFVAEGSTAVAGFTVSDPDPDDRPTLFITGADADKFILGTDGMLRFRTAPDYETPLSSNGTNIYSIAIQATDNSLNGPPLFATRSFTVEVTDVPGVHREGGADADILNGTGEADSLSGGGGDDILRGLGDNDELIGGAGNDTLDGGDGNDTVSYAASSRSVKIDLSLDGRQNAGSEGKDILISIENLIGSDQNDSLRGNAGSNTLFGGEGNDKIDGGAGADTLYGGYGNDRHWVDDVNDVVVEASDAGKDRVYASVDFLLPEHVEELVLIGSAALTGTGNALDNSLTANDAGNRLIGGGGDDIIRGGAGNDVLNGGTGADILTGGAGADIFVFDNREFSNRTDTIKDFVSNVDRIEISLSAFVGLNQLGPGQLEPGQLTYGKAATAGHPLYYNPANGGLYYDPDGPRGIAAVEIVKLVGSPDLLASDIVLV